MKKKCQTTSSIKKDNLFLSFEIHSDCWKSYSNLESLNYKHKRVNHSKNFIDPLTGANTQLIEVMWKHLKLKLLKRMNRTRREYIPGYLAERYYRMIHRNEEIFECILNDISKYYNKKLI
jgi:hypothetical protein